MAQDHTYSDLSINASLHGLPVELLLAIIEQVNSPSDLLALCLVSKKIYPRAKGKLWRSISLRVMEKDDYVRFASTLTTLVNSSSEDLECVKELKVLKLEYHRTFDHRDAKYCDPVIGLSNTLIALALRRMTGLRSFCWGTRQTVTRTVLEALHHCHRLRVLKMNLADIDFPHVEVVPEYYRFPDTQSLLCVPQFKYLVRIAFVGINSLSALRACCQLVSHCNTTVKHLRLRVWARLVEWLGDSLDDLLDGAVPLGSFEDTRSCNLREIAESVEKALKYVKLESLELNEFVWEKSMLQLPRCIFLPSLKHLAVTGQGCDDFFCMMTKRLEGTNDSMQLRSLKLECHRQVTTSFIKGLRGLQSFASMGHCDFFNSILEELCWGNATTIERVKILPSILVSSECSYTPGDINLLAKSIPNLRELHIQIPYIEGWAIPFKGFRELRVLVLSTATGDLDGSSVLRTFEDAIFGDEGSKLEYVKMELDGQIYQAHGGCFLPVNLEQYAHLNKIINGGDGDDYDW